MRFIAVYFGLLVALATMEASAQSSPRRVALVIANSDYAHATQLANPINDAGLVAGSLKQAGFQTVELKSNLGTSAFRASLREFRAKASGAEVALVYFAGHGVEGQGRNWLIPTDAALESEFALEDEAVHLDRVMESIEGASLRVVILDACRNNPFGRKWRSGTRAVQRGLGAVDADNVLVIYAAAPGETASDGAGGNSPFAKALAQRLPQANVPIQLLGGMVRDDVLRETGGQQRPFVSASITGTPFYLVPSGTAGGRPSGEVIPPSTSANPDAAAKSAATTETERVNKILDQTITTALSAAIAGFNVEATATTIGQIGTRRSECVFNYSFTGPQAVKIGRQVRYVPMPDDTSPCPPAKTALMMPSYPFTVHDAERKIGGWRITSESRDRISAEGRAPVELMGLKNAPPGTMLRIEVEIDKAGSRVLSAKISSLGPIPQDGMPTEFLFDFTMQFWFVTMPFEGRNISRVDKAETTVVSATPPVLRGSVRATTIEQVRSFKIGK